MTDQEKLQMYSAYLPYGLCVEYLGGTETKKFILNCIIGYSTIGYDDTDTIPDALSKVDYKPLSDQINKVLRNLHIIY